MPRRSFDLPTPESDADRKAIEDIHEYGWHAILVSPLAHPEHDEANEELARTEPEQNEIYDAAFAYTVGVWGSFGHPEIVLAGSWRHRHSYLANIVDLIEAGTTFAPGGTTNQLLEGLTVRFDAVSAGSAKTYLTWADWANLRASFEAVQLVLPDVEGRWPEHPDYNAFDQPLLS